MTVYTPPGSSFEVVIDTGLSGLVGDLGLLVIDNVGGVAVAFSTAGIIETPASSGVYATTLTAPATGGQYSVVWQLQSSGDTYGVEDLIVTSISPIPEPGAPISGGLCGAWAAGDEVLDCCDGDAGSDGSQFDPFAIEASLILYELSGRRYGGYCEQTRRPCRTQGDPCSFQVLSRGHLVGGWDGFRWAEKPCGCSPLSRVKLPGYPVQEVTEVLIDGDVVDPGLYRLDRCRYLVRMANPDGTAGSWPACQRMDLPDTEPGTFAVTYTYGSPPPLPGIEAAKQLACELWKACPANKGDCSLPSGTVRVDRQGVRIERKKVMTFLAQAPSGLVHVDAFLSTYAADGPPRRPAVWSPDSEPFAQRAG